MTRPPKTLPLIAVGDNCLDVYLTKNQMAVGGNALNVAVQWRAQGLAARYFGVVGEDPEGAAIAAGLEAARIDTADLERRPGSTAVTLLLEKDGDRRFLLEDLGVGRNYMPSAEHYAELPQAGWVHLGTNSAPDLLARLLRDGVPFSVDVSTAHDVLPLDGVPLVFAAGPEDRAAPVTGLIESFRAKGAIRTVLTCGSRGAVFDDAGTLHEVAAHPIEVVDTCGAGDSFIAAFVRAFAVEGQPPARALAEATDAAARTCLHPGGFPQPMATIPAWLLDKYAGIIAGAEG